MGCPPPPPMIWPHFQGEPKPRPTMQGGIKPERQGPGERTQRMEPVRSRCPYCGRLRGTKPTCEGCGAPS